MSHRQPTVSQLRPALELALEKARSDSSTTAARGSLPGPVRGLTLVRKLPPGWASTMARVIDSDDEFRSEVAVDADSDLLGPIPWLWLTRPSGWEDELDRLLDDEQRAREESSREAELQSRLEGAEARSEAARKELEEVGGRTTRLNAELDQLRRVANDRSAQIRRLEQKLTAAETQRSTLAAELADRDHRVLGHQAELTGARAELDSAVSRAQRAELDLAEATEEIDRLTRERAHMAAANQLVLESAVDARRAAGEALLEALAAGGALESALLEVASALGVDASAARFRPVSPPASTSRAAVPPAGSPPAVGTAGSGSSRRRGPRSVVPPASPAGRRQVALPPGLRDDSPEAAEHLVRAPGTVLLVDGYNVALNSWPGDELPDLRDRLVSALAELAVRTKLPVRVYFDGDQEGGRVPPPAVARPWLKVFFTPSSREADEEIVSAVRATDTSIAVVVASDDGQVRRDALALGASVVSVGQLLSVLGRRRSPTR